MILTTTDAVPGRRALRSLGLVRGSSVRSRSVFRDLLAMMRNLVGGEVREYTKVLGESREQALDRMREAALALGADAVVGIRFESGEIMTGAAEILVYGTAVVLEPAAGE